jgi:hypothetical protein
LFNTEILFSHWSNRNYGFSGSAPSILFASNPRVNSVAASHVLMWPDRNQIIPLLPEGTQFEVGALSPDRLRLITIVDQVRKNGSPETSRHCAQLWDAKTGQTVGGPLVAETEIFHAAFSQDSRFVLLIEETVTKERLVKVFDARSGEGIGKPIAHPQAGFATFSPDGSLIVTCGADRTARIWRTTTGQCTGVVVLHGRDVTHADFSPNGKFLATTSLDGTVRVWDTEHGTSLGMIECKSDFANVVAFDPNGLFLFIGSFTDGIRVLDVTSLQDVIPLQHSFPPQNLSRGRYISGENRLVIGQNVLERNRLIPDTRDTADILKIVQLYSTQRLDSRGVKISLTKSERQNIWETIRERCPEEFTVPPEVAVAWRVKQLRQDTEEGSVFLAFHRRWLAAELSEAGWQPGQRGNEEMERNDYLQRLYALAQYARHVEATSAADTLSARWSKDGETLSNCSSVYDLAAEAVKGDPELAFRYLGGAIALLRQAAEVGYKDSKYMERICTLAKQGKHIDATGIADVLEARLPKENGILYDCACIYSLSAGAVKSDPPLSERYALRAIAFLCQAADAGYKDSQHIRKDPDLDALRNREDFKKLLEERFPLQK